ncbi:putative mitogen-activated protein kinase kinase kinase STE-STE11 family [Helianthus debilis subsp. tardiflorus]
MIWKRGPIIGRGSSATVSTATTSTGDLFAVKSTTLSTSKYLQKEQYILSQITSKHVIQYMGFDVTYNNNKPIYNLFMEYATGGTITDMIKKLGGSLDECLIRSYTFQILVGLDDLQVNGIVHCDIKCRNLLVCESGVKIGDFGCAKMMGNGGTTSCFSGTPVFMAPEVARGEEQGFPADVWALGCVVIEMATGLSPWAGLNDPVSGLYRIGYSGEVPEFPTCLSEDGKDFLDKCFKVNAEERWTVKELLEHPFVRNLNSSHETTNSPTSILDQGFWECLPVCEISMERAQMVKFPGETPVERIRRLVEVAPSCLAHWSDEDDWIAVRSNQVEETNVEYSDCFGSIDIESFSSFNMIVDDEEDELESLVVNQYNMIL